MANTWYAFNGYNNNQAVNVSIFDMTELNALGFHGYPTQADANAKPNSVNIFQAPIVNAAIDDANNARDVASGPGNAAKAAANAAKKAAQSVLGNGWHVIFGNTTGLAGRILKVVFGGVLVIAGLLRITGAKKTITDVAKAAI